MNPSYKKVLVIDDDLSQRPIWELVFSRFDETPVVEWAVSSEQGQKLIRHAVLNSRTLFDLIITDLFLAGSETGFDFLIHPEVKQLKATSILVSAVSQDRLSEQYKSLLPETVFISKPLSVAKIEKALTTQLNLSSRRAYA